eukprot:8928782-Lingulodinium_polyedra.AAC.1
MGVPLPRAVRSAQLATCGRAAPLTPPPFALALRRLGSSLPRCLTLHPHLVVGLLPAGPAMAQ